MMKCIAITGSSGLVGQTLIKYFQEKGVRVIRIIRPQSGVNNSDDTIVWEPDHGLLESSRLNGIDAVIHLAGANIANKRWTDSYKQKIYDSRIKSTQFLVDKLAEMPNPPKILFSASAIGYYGYKDDGAVYTETSAPADDFLANVCKDWEAATQPLAQKGVRVVQMRFGVILSKKGGALAKMLLPFLLGAGGKLGDGSQMMSWIALKEIPRAIEFLAKHDITGPVNFTAPNPVDNIAFTKTLGRVIHRPTIFPVPAFGAKLLFGEMADVLLLNGLKVVPKKLTDAGYHFEWPDLEGALKEALK